MTTVRDFVDGAPLEYVGAKGENCELIYRVGEGLWLEVDGKEEALIETDDVGARRVYWSLMRRNADMK